jgi:mRNA-degrading endonuclease RelE of RelBE toxin-antitoxin system
MPLIKLIYLPAFLRKLKKCDQPLQEEIKGKIVQFQNRTNHEQLKVHKLKGSLSDYYSFSVTYKHRVIFFWEDAETAVFLSVGDHDVYN